MFELLYLENVVDKVVAKLIVNLLGLFLVRTLAKIVL